MLLVRNRGPKKVVVTLLLKFGNKDIPGDPTKPLQDYLAKHAGKLAQPFNEPAKILSISILPPGKWFFLFILVGCK